MFVSPLPGPGPLLLKQIPVHYFEGGERELAPLESRAFGEGHEHAVTFDLGCVPSTSAANGGLRAPPWFAGRRSLQPNGGSNPVTCWGCQRGHRPRSRRQLKPAKDKATERIDGIVALIIAIGRALVAKEEPEPEYSMFFLR